MLVLSIENKAAFLATQFEASMVGLGTRVPMLSRVAIRSREPALLASVKVEFQYMYGMTLRKRIDGEQLPSAYRTLLLAVLDMSD